jgi:hypothetical protein
MKCPSCTRRMKCLDTRWQEATKTTVRRHACDCGVRGRTIESWDGSLAPQGNTLRQPKSKKLPVVKASDSLQAAMYNMTKKQKHVGDKHKPPKSAFDSMDEDYSYGDKYDDIGIDIPRGDDW